MYRRSTPNVCISVETFRRNVSTILFVPSPQSPVIRFWRFWFQTFVISSQYNPPRFVELLMLMLAIAMLTIATFIPDRPFLVLGLSLVVGASISILVREAIAPSPQTRITQITALLLLIISIYGFADIIKTL